MVTIRVTIGFEMLNGGGSNEYPQSMFLSKNKKNNIYPANPSFTM